MGRPSAHRGDRLASIRIHPHEPSKEYENIMNAEEMSAKIVALVGEQGHPTFVGLMEVCGPEAKGSLSLEYRGNLVLWSGVSQLFVHAFSLSLSRIEPHPTSALTYYIDGCAPIGLPVAKSIREFKNPRWLPVTFGMKDDSSHAKRGEIKSARKAPKRHAIK